MKRIFGLLVLATATAFVAPAVANAQYPTSAPVVTVSSASLAPGEALTLGTQNFCAGAAVTFRIGGTSVGTATASAAGVASLVTTAPAAAGSYTVTAASTTPCALTTSSTINVAAAPGTTAGGGLPATGSEPMNWVRAGGIAVLLGFGLIGAARLRRPNTAV